MTFLHRDSGTSREQRITYHLVPEEVWQTQRLDSEYLPEAFPHDGFIHCTNGLDELLNVANRYYVDDAREFIVLALDLSRVTAEVRYDDPGQLFPHIYGPLNTDAIVHKTTVTRSSDGTFLTLAG